MDKRCAFGYVRPCNCIKKQESGYAEAAPCPGDLRCRTTRQATRSSTRSPTSPSSTGPRIPRSWCAARPSSATRRSRSPTSAPWQGVVRAHRAAGEVGLPLIVGTELALDPATRVVLLATDRAAYGRLSALITRARRSAEKGAYRLKAEDMGEGVEGCLALLVAGSRSFAAWLAERFPGRLWLAVTLHHGPDDAGVLEARRHLGRRLGLPLVAAGGVRMHERGRRPLADTLSAIRLGCRVSELGFRFPRQRGVPPALPPAARPDLSARPAGRERVDRLAVPLLCSASCATSTPKSSFPRGFPPGSTCAG